MPFDKNGFPDFSKVSVKTVRIQQTGQRVADRAAANRAAGIKSEPPGYTWHHHQDGRTMQLVPTQIHVATGHTGGVALGGGGK
ncbi:MAG: HNH endonuclease [Candidatus Zixiibacteriota bacterium]